MRGKGSESFPSLGRKKPGPNPIMTLKTPPPAGFLVLSTTGSQTVTVRNLVANVRRAFGDKLDEQGRNPDDSAYRQVSMH